MISIAFGSSNCSLPSWFKIEELLNDDLWVFSDIGAVVSALYPETPPVILMGHSMGGAIAVHATHSECIDSVVALIVIDVVEGTAVDALTSMQSFLRSRPTSFKSVKDAISWRSVYFPVSKCSTSYFPNTHIYFVHFF